MFDTNIYYYIASGIITGQEENVIIGSRDSKGYRYFCSPIPISEIYKHIGEGDKSRDYYAILEKIDSLCNCNFFPPPDVHVRKEIQNALGIQEDYYESYSRISDVVRKLRNGEIPTTPIIDYTGVYDPESGWVTLMNNVRKGIIENAIELARARFPNNRISQKGVKTELSKILDKDETLNRFYVNFLIRNRALDIPGTGDPEIRDSLYSCKYYAAVFKALLKKAFMENKSFKINDYFDLEQAVYLNKIDYLVTYDKTMNRTFNAASKYYGLKQKLIDFGSFFESIVAT